MRLVAGGAAIGTMAAYLATRPMATMLFGTAVHDPLVFSAAPLALGLVALAACLRPAASATRVDPAVTLRSE